MNERDRLILDYDEIIKKLEGVSVWGKPVNMDNPMELVVAAWYTAEDEERERGAAYWQITSKMLKLRRLP